MVSAKSSLTVRQTHGLRGDVRVPGDKSISHRAVLFSLLANGTFHIRRWLAAGDTEASLACIRALGLAVERLGQHEIIIEGGTQRAPSAPLDFVNAGTGIRLAAGLMAGQSFGSVLDGSAQLRRRPMRRITGPLQQMGAQIEDVDGRAPLTIHPAALHGIEYTLPVASAQVKSALLLAGLLADGPTTIIEPGPARDHTERMLQAMGANIVTVDNRVTITPGAVLQPLDFTVPGDFSSAAFLLVAGCIVPDSELTIRGVNLNPTRTGLLDVLLAMGADIQVRETGLEAGEPAGDITVRTSQLQGVSVDGEIVVRMIDEFPVFMVAALCASGRTTVRDAAELRVKETDRLAVMTAELARLGAVITETEDGFVIDGPQRLAGGAADGHDDHRVAMSLAVAGLVADGQTLVHDARCAADSFPGFAETLQQLGALVVTTEDMV